MISAFHIRKRLSLLSKEQGVIKQVFRIADESEIYLPDVLALYPFLAFSLLSPLFHFRPNHRDLPHVTPRVSLIYLTLRTLLLSPFGLQGTIPTSPPFFMTIS